MLCCLAIFQDPPFGSGKEALAKRETLLQLRSFSVFGSVLDPSDAQRDFVEWDGHRREEKHAVE